jgi:hypothetical protein
MRMSYLSKLSLDVTADLQYIYCPLGQTEVSVLDPEPQDVNIYKEDTASGRICICSLTNDPPSFLKPHRRYVQIDGINVITYAARSLIRARYSI